MDIKETLNQMQMEGCLNPGLKGKKCSTCKKPYIEGSITVDGKEVTYWYPQCSCIAKEEAEKEAKQAAMLKKEADRLKRVKAGLGGRFILCNFENYNKKFNLEAYGMCQKYAESFNSDTVSGLFLIGPVGTGKTHLCSAIVNKLIDRGIDGAYILTMAQMLSEIKEAMKEGGAEHKQNEFEKAKLLVIDDLGVENLTDWSREVLYKIINYRYERNLPLIVTTNLEVDGLTEKFDYRIISRLFEVCEGVVLKGEDYRRLKFEET